MSNRVRRSFAASFKAQIVLSLLSGEKSQAEICREHQLSPALVAAWKDAFVSNAASVFTSPEQRSEESAKLAEMERLVGRMTWEIEALKKGSALLRQGKLGEGKS
jgi:transposase-like protein